MNYHYNLDITRFRQTFASEFDDHMKRMFIERFKVEEGAFGI